MDSQKSPWRALTTFLAASFLLLGILAYLAGFYAGDWPVVVIMVLLPALGLLTLAFRYVAGPPSRRGRLVRAVIFGFLAGIYLVSNLAFPESGWLSLPEWTIFIAWLMLSLSNLHLAYRTEQNPGASS